MTCNKLGEYESCSPEQFDERCKELEAQGYRITEYPITKNVRQYTLTNGQTGSVIHILV